MPKILASFLLGIALSYALFTPAARAEDTLPCPAPATVGNSLPDTTASAGDSLGVDTEAASVPPYPNAPSISELLPDPAGDDTAGEFIEIHNSSAEIIALSGWYIEDAKGARHTFGEATLGPSAYLYLMYAETKLRQPNTGGSFSIHDPAGVIRNEVAYAGPVPAGKSYALVNGSWTWVEPTPGTANRAAEPTPPLPVPQQTEVLSVGASEQQTTVTSVGDSMPVIAQISITALLPNPDGDDVGEWVELKNSEMFDVVLTGWSISDAANVTFQLDGVRIPANTTYRVMKSESRMTLNNTEEEVRLISPGGTVSETVRYEDAPSGVPYVKIASGDWQWGESTAAVALVEQMNNADAQEGEVVGDALLPDTVSIPELESFDNNETAIVEAVVTLPPGVIGKSLFAIRDRSSENGAFVRMYGKGPFPVLKNGEVVRIIGRVKSDGPVRLASTAKEVSRTNVTESLPPVDVDLSNLGADYLGLEVSVHGIVTRRAKRTLAISDATGRVEVTARLASGELPNLEQGVEVMVSGVVRGTSSGYEIIVTDTNDVLGIPAVDTEAVLEAEIEPESVAVTQRAPMNLSAAAKNIVPDPWVTGGALAASAGLSYALWRRRTEPQIEAGGAETIRG